MFRKTKIALSAAIILSTAFAASVVTDPDHYGQAQLPSDQTPSTINAVVFYCLNGKAVVSGGLIRYTAVCSLGYQWRI
jgi:hypothetical protein